MNDGCAGADDYLFILDLQPTTHPFSHGECGECGEYDEYDEYGGRDNEQTTKKKRPMVYTRCINTSHDVIPLCLVHLSAYCASFCFLKKTLERFLNTRWCIRQAVTGTIPEFSCPNMDSLDLWREHSRILNANPLLLDAFVSPTKRV